MVKLKNYLILRKSWEKNDYFQKILPPASRTQFFFPTTLCCCSKHFSRLTFEIKEFLFSMEELNELKKFDSGIDRSKFRQNAT